MNLAPSFLEEYPVYRDTEARHRHREIGPLGYMREHIFFNNWCKIAGEAARRGVR